MGKLVKDVIWNSTSKTHIGKLSVVNLKEKVLLSCAIKEFRHPDS